VNAPDIVKNNPNASFVASAIPFSAFVGWLLPFAGVKGIPGPAMTGLGTAVGAGALFFAHGCKVVAGAVWEYGPPGLCKRLWGGRPDK
jgi:hypothetical protein